MFKCYYFYSGGKYVDDGSPTLAMTSNFSGVMKLSRNAKTAFGDMITQIRLKYGPNTNIEQFYKI